jgi:tRNA-dihydrouridine synthase
MNIPVFGNGDIDTPEKAVEYKNRYNVDGVMIGRASIGYPWIFNEIKHFINTGEHLAPPTVNDRVEAAIQHLEMSVEWKGEILGIAEMKRHYTNYFKGIAHFKKTRMKLVTSFDLNEIRETLDEIKENADRYEFVS